jgi:ribosomal protein S27E
MPFMTKCPGCGKNLQVPDAAVGKRVKCPDCSHTWQVAPPAAAATVGQPPSAVQKPAAQPRAAVPQTGSGIDAKCPGCGKDIQIPASAAGKRVKCPACAHTWLVPGGVVDAEAVPELPKLETRFDDLMSDSYPLSTDVGRMTGPAGQPAASAEPPRRPCPMCGEMIVVGAAKCRFCDAVFDETLRRAEKKRKKRRGGGDDEDLTAGDWIMCVICPVPVCIAGLIYLLLGKPKALKLIGACFLFIVFWNIVFFIIGSLTHAPGPPRGF